MTIQPERYVIWVFTGSGAKKYFAGMTLAMMGLDVADRYRRYPERFCDWG